MIKRSFAIGRLDHYTTDGEYDTTTYQIQVTEADDYISDISIDSIDELIALRDALSTFIDKNHCYEQ